jgi:hypothetical protein
MRPSGPGKHSSSETARSFDQSSAQIGKLLEKIEELTAKTSYTEASYTKSRKVQGSV